MSLPSPCSEEERVADTAELARACHDINSSLAAIVTCLEYLAGQTSGDSRDAVTDAFGAARRIEAITAQLRRRLAATPPRAA
jgi:hypothetical protein